MNQDKGVEGSQGCRQRARAGWFVDALLQGIMSKTVFGCLGLLLFYLFSGLGSISEAQTAGTSAGSAVQVTIPTSISQQGFTGGVPSGKLSPEPLQISFLELTVFATALIAILYPELRRGVGSCQTRNMGRSTLSLGNLCCTAPFCQSTAS